MAISGEYGTEGDDEDICAEIGDKEQSREEEADNGKAVNSGHKRTDERHTFNESDDIEEERQGFMEGQGNADDGEIEAGQEKQK